MTQADAERLGLACRYGTVRRTGARVMQEEWYHPCQWGSEFSRREYDAVRRYAAAAYGTESTERQRGFDEQLWKVIDWFCGIGVPHAVPEPWHIPRHPDWGTGRFPSYDQLLVYLRTGFAPPTLDYQQRALSEEALKAGVQEPSHAELVEATMIPVVNTPGGSFLDPDGSVAAAATASGLEQTTPNTFTSPSVSPGAVPLGLLLGAGLLGVALVGTAVAVFR